MAFEAYGSLVLMRPLLSDHRQGPLMALDARLQEQLQALAETTDVHGRGLDEGIIGLVALLNLAGVDTVDSCAGHADSGSTIGGVSLPYVIPAPEHTTRAERLLDDFYGLHSQEERLVVERKNDSRFGTVLRGKTDLHEALELPLDARRALLARQQEEMDSFAGWLRQMLEITPEPDSPALGL